MSELRSELRRLKSREKSDSREGEVSQDSILSRRKFLKGVIGGTAGISAAAVLPSAAGFSFESNKPFEFSNLSGNDTNMEIEPTGGLDLHGNEIKNLRNLGSEANPVETINSTSVRTQNLSVAKRFRTVGPDRSRDRIQSALDDVNKLGGGTVMLLGESYDIEEPIEVGDNTALIGSGKGQTELQCKVDNDFAVKVEGKADVANHVQYARLENLRFRHNSGSSRGGLLVKYADNCEFRRLDFRTFDDGREAIREVSSWEHVWYDIDCVGGDSTTSTAAHLITSSPDSQSNHNEYIRCKWGGSSGTLLKINNSHVLKFIGSKTNLTADETCVKIQDNPSNTSQPPRDFVFIGHEFSRDGGIQEATGIEVSAGQRLSLTGCLFYDLKTGLTGYDANLDGTMVGCQFTNVENENDLAEWSYVAGNPGYDSTDQGRTKISSGSKTVTVNHDGESVFNSGNIDVTPLKPLGNASSYHVDLGSNQFDIVLDQDPGKEVEFAWSVQKYQ